LSYQMEIKFELDVVDDRKHHHHLRLLYVKIAEFHERGCLADVRDSAPELGKLAGRPRLSVTTSSAPRDESGEAAFR